ncbi:MAG: DUF3892 domain-containing protein [Chloroflexota bacterium]
MSQKWADYLITRVHYDRYRQGYSVWKRINSVETRVDSEGGIGSAQVWMRQKVVDAINHGQTFVTSVQRNDGLFYKGAEIEVVRINNTDYIRTDRDSTTEDNLGSLPEF